MERKISTTGLIILTILWTGSMFAQLGSRVLINGYSSFEFEKQFGDEGEGDPNGSFDADLFDLVVNIYATERLRIATDVSWEHGTATEEAWGNAALEYGFGEYALNEALKFRAGKMFTYFGIYNEIHTAKPAFLTVKEPLSTNKNEKFGSDDEGRFYPRWQTGLAMLGNATIGAGLDFDYIVQVSNGSNEQTNPFEEDDNKQKAVNGRIRFTPSDVGQFGLSVYNDFFTVLDDSSGDDTGERGQLFSLGVHGDVSLGPITVEGEFVTGYVDLKLAPRVARNALSAMLFLNVSDTYVPYLRYEWLDPNRDIDNDSANMFVYGINVQVDDGLFLKAELNTIQSKENNVRFTGINYTELKAAIAIGF